VAFDDVEFYQADGSLVVGTPTGARVQITSDGIEGYNSTPSKQFYIRTSDGRAGFGGDPPKGVLDSSGLVLSGNESSYNSYNAVRWMTATDPPGGNEVARVAAGGFVAGWEGDAGLHVYANPQGQLAQSAMRALARAASASRYADMVLDASAKGGVAWLKAAGASYGGAFIEVNSLESGVLSSNWRSAGKRIVMGFDTTADSPTWSLTSDAMLLFGDCDVYGDYYIDGKRIISGYYSGSLSYKYTSGTWFNLLNTSNLGSTSGYFLIKVEFASSGNGGTIYSAQLLILASMKHGTNSTEHFTVPMHIGATSLNSKTIQAWTQLTAKADGKTYLQLNINESPTSAVTFTWAAIRIF